VLADPPSGQPEVILIATGSEVAMTVDAYERLSSDGRNPGAGGQHAVDGTVRQATLLLPRRGTPAVDHCPGVGGEGLHVRLGRWVGPTGAIIGMSTFGASAPLKVLQAKFGFTLENIVATARTQLGLEHDTDTPGVTLETSETSETSAQ
jgi:transketolase